MAKMMLVLSADEVHQNIAYSLICMTRYGSSWGTMKRKRRWAEEFSENERKTASKLFREAHCWTCGKGVPDEVTMSLNTYSLWQKLGAFCASI